MCKGLLQLLQVATRPLTDLNVIEPTLASSNGVLFPSLYQLHREIVVPVFFFGAGLSSLLFGVMSMIF